jgi:hypothetical protein
MNDEIFENRNHNLNKNKLNIGNLKQNLLDRNLTLRKKKIKDIINSKRFNYTAVQTYAIDINKLDAPDFIKNDYKKYLKSFDIKTLFQPLNNKENLNNLKLALFLLRNYLLMQNEEIPYEQRKLSRNDYDLIKLIIDCLTFNDKEVQYEASWILILLCDFPSNIEKRLHNEENIDKINNFIFNSDIILAENGLYLIANLCLSDENEQKKLLELNVLPYLENLLKNPNLIEKTVLNIARAAIYIAKNYVNEQSILNYYKTIINIINNILHFFLKVSKAQFVKNEENLIYLFKLISLVIEFENKSVLECLFKTNFLYDFYLLYRKTQDKQTTYNYIEILVTLCAFDDSYARNLIDAGYLILIKELLEKYKFSDLIILRDLFFSLSNLCLGPILNIEDVNNMELFSETINIFKIYSTSNYIKKDIEIINVLYECSYVLNNAICGAQDKLIYEILTIDNFQLIHIYKFILENMVDYKRDKYMDSCISSLYKIFNSSENVMNDNEPIKDLIIKDGIIDLLERIINDRKLSKSAYNYACMLIEGIENKETVLN